MTDDTNTGPPPRTMRDTHVSIGCVYVASHREHEFSEDKCSVHVAREGSGSLELRSIDAVRDLHAALGAWLERAKP